MARIFTLAAVVLLPAAAHGVAPGGGVMSAGPYGAGGGVMVGDPSCERGTIFTSLQVARAYRDNAAFAFKHFEGKRIEISGRLVAIRRDKLVVDNKVVFEGFVALVTPDGKIPKPVGLEFRFPLAAVKADPALACALANLFAGQFVTLSGVCIGPPPTPEGDYIGVIFEDAQIIR
jgi:hypothetical protein